MPRPDPRTIATFESRQAGGYARAAKIREQRELVEEIKLERLADAPTPRRRRRRRAFGLRDPYERTSSMRSTPSEPQEPRPDPRPVNEQGARGGPCWWEDTEALERRRREWIAARYEL